MLLISNIDALIASVVGKKLGHVDDHETVDIDALPHNHLVVTVPHASSIPALSSTSTTAAISSAGAAASAAVAAATTSEEAHAARVSRDQARHKARERAASLAKPARIPARENDPDWMLVLAATPEGGEIGPFSSAATLARAESSSGSGGGGGKADDKDKEKEEEKASPGLPGAENSSASGRLIAWAAKAPRIPDPANPGAYYYDIAAALRAAQNNPTSPSLSATVKKSAATTTDPIQPLPPAAND